MEKREKKEICIILLVVVLHTFIIYFFSSYSKVLETYGDEIIYYDIAKSIFNNDGIKVHAVPVGFANFLYSIVLVPVFLIKDTVSRVNIIMLINSFLVSLAIFPTYLLCKLLEVKKIYLWVVIAIVFCWPDMMIASTFMSENLYFPLSAITFYFCIKAFNGNSKKDVVVAGIFTYFLYFCKAVGICVFIVYIVVELLFAILQYLKFTKQGIKESFIEYISWKSLILYVVSFAISYVVMNLIVFHNIQNSYTIDETISLSSLVGSYVWWYLCYVLFYSLITVILAFLILPIFVPAFNYKRLSNTSKKAYLFEIILLLGTLLVIGVMISLKEDLGKEIPRVHLRYLFPMITLFLPTMFSESENESESGQRINRLVYPIITIYYALLLLCFKGVKYGCSTEDSALMYVCKMRDWLPDLSGHGIIIYRSAIILTIILFILFLVQCVLYCAKGEKCAIYFWGMMSVIICICSSYGEYKLIRGAYGVDALLVEEMDKINDYFWDNHLCDSNTIYISNSVFDKDAKAYDLYFDASVNEYELTYQQLINLIDRGEKEISKCIFEESIWGRRYEIDTIDYIITASPQVEHYVGGLEYIDNIGNEKFYVYKNTNNRTIESALDPNNIFIGFTDKLNNANNYVREGISVCEGEYTWTDGSEFLVHADGVSFEKARVKIDIVNTYNGKQNFIILQEDEVIFNGSAIGQDEVVFEILPNKGIIEFTVYLMNSISPKENGEGEDPRALALALKQMTIEKIGD